MKEKRKLTLQKIMDSDHYRSIYLLTRFFDKGDGLKPQHYRWALIKNHDGINQPQVVAEMEDFFSDIDDQGNKKLEMYYNRPSGIVRNCISSKTNLSNFLKKMVNEYKFLEPHKHYNTEGKYKGITTYKIDKSILRDEADPIRKMMIKTITDLPDNEIFELYDIFSDYLFDFAVKHLGLKKNKKK